MRRINPAAPPGMQEQDEQQDHAVDDGRTPGVVLSTSSIGRPSFWAKLTTGPSTSPE